MGGEDLTKGTEMARWIKQTLSVNEHAQIILNERSVRIGDPDDDLCAVFYPKTREEANSQSVALKMAAKRLEDIGKELEPKVKS